MKLQSILQVPDLVINSMQYFTQEDLIKVLATSRGVRTLFLSAMDLWPLPLIKLSSPKKNITDTELKAVLSYSKLFQSITSLSLPKCRELTDESLKIFQSIKNLTELSLYGCCQVTNHGLIHLVHCSKLESLDLSNCSKITRLKALSGLFGQLKTLNLAQCSNLRQVTFFSSSAVASPSNSATSLLLKLDLSLCRHINDKRLTCCLQLLPCLQVLSIRGCSSVTNLGLYSIRDYSPRLAVLDISWLYQVTLEGLASSLGQLHCLSEVSMCGMKSPVVTVLRLLLPSVAILADF